MKLRDAAKCEGKTFKDITVELFIDEETARPRFKVVGVFKQQVLVEMPRKLLTKHGIGTRFSLDARVVQKHDSGTGAKRGRPYMYAVPASIKVDKDSTPKRSFKAVPRPDSVSGRAFLCKVCTRRKR